MTGTFETVDIKDCTACGRNHRLIHILSVSGLRYYYCPVTEKQVLVGIAPLEPEAA